VLFEPSQHELLDELGTLALSQIIAELKIVSNPSWSHGLSSSPRLVDFDLASNVVKPKKHNPELEIDGIKVREDKCEI
jgi:hypothetical protein